MPSSIFEETYKLMIQRLVVARKKSRLTQAEAAKKLGKSQSMISKLESCERRVDVLELAELASLYNVSLDLVLSDVTAKYMPHRRKK